MTALENSLPLISVIIPIYKVEAHLRPCVDSVLSQSYANLEVILVNDGSPDNCRIICDEYAEKDQRVTVIHKQNGGLSDARNCGLDIATGDYIAFVDGDDILHIDFLASLYQNLVATNCDISFCRFQPFKDGEEFVVPKRSEAQDGIRVLSGLQMMNTFYDESWFPRNIVVWNKLYKASVFQQLRFPKGRLHEDAYIFPDLYGEPIQVVYTDVVLLGYRVRNASIMSNPFTDLHLQSWVEIYDRHQQIYAQRGWRSLLKELDKNRRRKYFSFFVNGSSTAAKSLISPKMFFKLLLDKDIHWKKRAVLIKLYIMG